MRTITEAEFDEIELEDNHLVENASWEGKMFETYGEEFEHVKAVHTKHPNRVLTILDEGDNLFVESGVHVINRLGYLITKNDHEPFHCEFDCTCD